MKYKNRTSKIIIIPSVIQLQIPPGYFIHEENIFPKFWMYAKTSWSCEIVVFTQPSYGHVQAWLKKL